MLRRLSYPNRLRDLVKMFHRSPSTISEIFNWTVKHVYHETVGLVSRLRQPWMRRETFNIFADVRSQKKLLFLVIPSLVLIDLNYFCNFEFLNRVVRRQALITTASSDSWMELREEYADQNMHNDFSTVATRKLMF